MSLVNPFNVAPKTFARSTGALYLAFIVTAVVADVLGHIGLGTAQQMADSIATDPGAFRLGLVFAYFSALLFLLTAWGLYVLLRPVNHDLALLFLLLNAVGVAIQCASQLGLVGALLTSDAAAGSIDVASAQMQLLALEVYRTGFVTTQLFFGAWLFPLGYLVLKSRFLPWLLGALLILDGVAELVWFLQALLLPAYPAIKVPGTAVSLVAEVGLTLWLLIMGVKVEKPSADAPRESVAAASGGGR
ncbi:DUF4386 domain-containing protein [Propionicimonas sp.]|uniref:DUF4386 domain-containing protein n=1 Tax=Propionicimonas sp. TaxID=1955623 RepID=UPI0018292865|nr:DUF4386 domain-containing protein [Propionicimonas sp.]MBU3977796.1 DUF4386 domain-containing protein [Actinomycetota bacterium]MBA3021719.1 DUF4386 domain-containing protein [Propionicimonas sp.]MBU3987270.1 DUF4386 domain-containing protein [Actinomycetota bacterium]MBU4009091.1 DUF4386 domain-containing protein [Actinomycetota bacterium]MBU4065759.1 DUF4386 domain-containing protein [Actinomycetota bacterium]